LQASCGRRHLLSFPTRRSSDLGLAAAAPLAAGDDAKKSDDKGWVQLFNGKDLTGWKTHPSDKAKWEVKDGLLVSSGPKGHLFSRSEEHTSELQSQSNLVCRLLL